MKKEYDFSEGIRGKYYKKFQGKNNIVVLEKEVLKEFPDAKAVNYALKKLIRILKLVRRKT